jgi:phosphatidylethanolamine-binding protein (PEBP) family uncharacterized protein
MLVNPRLSARWVLTLVPLALLHLAEGLGRDEVMSAFEGHIIGEGQVTGISEREG